MPDRFQFFMRRGSPNLLIRLLLLTGKLVHPVVSHTLDGKAACTHCNHTQLTTLWVMTSVWAVTFAIVYSLVTLTVHMWGYIAWSLLWGNGAWDLAFRDYIRYLCCTIAARIIRYSLQKKPSCMEVSGKTHICSQCTRLPTASLLASPIKSLGMRLARHLL